MPLKFLPTQEKYKSVTSLKNTCRSKLFLPKILNILETININGSEIETYD